MIKTIKVDTMSEKSITKTAVLLSKMLYNINFKIVSTVDS